MTRKLLQPDVCPRWMWRDPQDIIERLVASPKSGHEHARVHVPVVGAAPVLFPLPQGEGQGEGGLPDDRYTLMARRLLRRARLQLHFRLIRSYRP